MNFWETFSLKRVARASLYSVFSIIALIIISLSTFLLLDFLEKSYRSISGLDKKEPVEIHKKTENKPKSRESIVHKLKNAFFVWYLNCKYAAEIKKNEAYAFELLEKYSYAQLKYKSIYGVFAKNAAGLIIKQKGSAYKIIDPDLEVINFSIQNNTAINGYFFIYPKINQASNNNLTNSDFFLYAVPDKYGITGINTLCVNSKTIVLKKDIAARNMALDYITGEIDSSWVRFKEASP
ncbi:MAG: hypothetical protein HY810_00030 [Candidatus Omnitrophica bacterium]|nr:hypothetical protein [Candidatus Omnitrophota bacterium]